MKSGQLLFGVLVAGGVWMGARVTAAKETRAVPTGAACGANGYRVIAVRWDAVLKVNWELRQDCAHPDRPAHLVLGPPGRQSVGRHSAMVRKELTDVAVVQSVLVLAGDPVRVWMQDAMVRIEMSGMAEEPARLGERTTVRITQQDEDGGLVVERIGGIVRGAGDVEMDR